MEMTVDIASIMTNDVAGVHWNVSEDEASKHSAVAMMKICSANVVEVLKIELGWHAIVVSGNQNLSSIETFQEP
jgi:ribosomal protein S4E